MTRWLQRIWRRILTVRYTAIVFAVVFIFWVIVRMHAKSDAGPIHIADSLLVVLAVHLLDRAFLHRDVERSFRNTLSVFNDIFRVAPETGLFAIRRHRRAAEADIRKAMEEAKTEICLLGVTFAMGVSIVELAALARQKQSEGIKVRVLMLDPLCSAAVIRACYESPASETRSILEGDIKFERDNHPYFGTYLWRRSDAAMRTLHEISAGVRFYKTAPALWMVLVDKEIAFYQPYIFGAIRTPVLNAGIEHLPLFVFKEADHHSCVNDLQLHFDKTWNTAAADWEYMRLRRNQRHEILAEVFARQGSWLKDLSSSLATMESSVGERRQDRRYSISRNIQASLQWNGSTITIGIKDFSMKSLGAIADSEPPHCGTEVALKFTEPVMGALVERFVSPC